MSSKRRPSEASPVREPQETYVRNWVEFVIGHAVNDPALTRHGRVDPSHFQYLRDSIAEPHAEALGLLLQMACEIPAEFKRMFGAIMFDGMTDADLHPFTESGLGFISQIYRNGIMDDWEIYITHTDRGWKVIREGQQGPADQRFNWKIAAPLLYRYVGGRRDTPSMVEVGALIQSQMEEAPPSPSF